jgi:GTP-binding protein
MLGLGDLLDEIVKRLPEENTIAGIEGAPINLAIVGKPNVGKSSLTNRLLKQERVMVSNIPGTTRDAIDTLFEHTDGSVYNIIDTAGIRRKRSIEEQSLERYSVLRSIAAIRRCDVAILVIDAQDGVTEQDMRIAGLIREEGKAAVIAVNKWDALEKETGTLETYRTEVLDKLKFINYAPVLFISALTGQRIPQLWETVSLVYAQSGKRIPTGTLNELLGEAQMGLQPPMEGGRRLKIFYATQQGTFPPTFLLFVNDPQLMHFAYERYLENQMRKAFDFTGTPIRFFLRERNKEDA